MDIKLNMYGIKLILDAPLKRDYHVYVSSNREVERH